MAIMRMNTWLRFFFHDRELLDHANFIETGFFSHHVKPESKIIWTKLESNSGSLGTQAVAVSVAPLPLFIKLLFVLKDRCFLACTFTGQSL